jgi:glucose/arabinose dehydrogenase
MFDKKRLAKIAGLATLTSNIYAQEPPAQPVVFELVYAAECAVCHGDNLEGAAQGTPLVGVELKHGDSIDALSKVIAEGVAGTAMPGWAETLDADKVRQLAFLIRERRANLGYADFKIGTPSAIPQGDVVTEAATFRVETFATGIDDLPFALAPLPDGSMLVTEKQNGIRVISPNGELSALVEGTPQGHEDGFKVPGILLTYGLGWIMDVKPHPDYAQNGWIYLQYGDRCDDCNPKYPLSMNKLVRGRIKDGQWTDQETIWSADPSMYTPIPDMGAGGRITFDDAGHVFISVGIKGYGEHLGIQDLSLPYGKIHRVNDDGTIPSDNPFATKDGAMPSIWTYGHRSPQGLEFDPATGTLWETEMGQRGGDEVNVLKPGSNYGWPLTSHGMQYTGAPVAFGPELGITFNPDDLVEPVVDLTPAPAVSSFVVYDGAAFPAWKGNLIVGSLKATELYRMVVENGQVVHRELLLQGAGRIRDVATGSDGSIYLLIEHDTGGKVLRLTPSAG